MEFQSVLVISDQFWNGYFLSLYFFIRKSEIEFFTGFSQFYGGLIQKLNVLYITIAFITYDDHWHLKAVVAFAPAFSTLYSTYFSLQYGLT